MQSTGRAYRLPSDIVLKEFSRGGDFHHLAPTCWACAAKASPRPPAGCSGASFRYARGRITVLDRPKLEKSVCECYQVVKKEYDRLLV